MPPTKKPIGLIPALYRSALEDNALYFWVEGQKRIIPSITVAQSIDLFVKYIGGEDWDTESLRTTYDRMQKKFYNAAKGL